MSSTVVVAALPFRVGKVCKLCILMLHNSIAAAFKTSLAIYGKVTRSVNKHLYKMIAISCLHVFLLLRI